MNTPIDTDRLIRAAWEDDVSFESIFIQFGLTEDAVIDIMRKTLTHKMFVVWRKRVTHKKTKHYKKKVRSLEYAPE